MNKLGSIRVMVHKEKNDMRLFNNLMNKLNKLGYKIYYHEPYDDRDFFFFQIDKDKKECFTYSSIVGPAAMASNKKRPLSMSLMYDLNKVILDDKTSPDLLNILEKLAFLMV